MSEKGKRSILHVLRAGPGFNVVPLNDVLVFMYEHQVAPEAIREFTERTASACKELDETVEKEKARRREQDEEIERRRRERVDAKNKKA